MYPRAAMGRRNDRGSPRSTPSGFEGERTLAGAEEDRETTSGTDDARCPCGCAQFLLEGFFAVEEGRLSADPVELGSLTCPECGREFEAVQAEDGRVLRGELLGYVEVGGE